MSINDTLTHYLQTNDLLLIKIQGCPDCLKLINLLNSKKLNDIYSVFDLSTIEDDEEYADIVENLQTMTGTKKMPMLFIKGKYIGDYKEIVKLDTYGQFNDMITSCGYDVESDF